MEHTPFKLFVGQVLSARAPGRTRYTPAASDLQGYKARLLRPCGCARQTAYCAEACGRDGTAHNPFPWLLHRTRRLPSSPPQVPPLCSHRCVCTLLLAGSSCVWPRRDLASPPLLCARVGSTIALVRRWQVPMHLTSEQLRPVFEPFGTIEDITIIYDKNTQQSRGERHAYRRARNAIRT